MKKFLKPFALLLLATLIIIQFFRPQKNVSESSVIANEISTVHYVPGEVQQILKASCYDCHSNSTQYPWYWNIQPVAWWLADHINEGKKELNFSEFATYRIGRKYRKLEEISKEIEENEMPLSSYTLIHTETKLNTQQKESIDKWVTTLRDSIKANYPEDSLKRPKRPQQTATK